MENKLNITYWKWLFHGVDGSKPGISQYCDRWLIFHIIVASILCYSIPVDADMAKSLVIPFVSILIAITVAWCGNITSLLNTEEIIELSTYHPLGIEAYAFTVQNAVLVLFITIIVWVIYGFSILNNSLGKFLVFFMSSVAIRDSWNLILLAQQLTITRIKILLHKKNTRR